MARLEELYKFAKQKRRGRFTGNIAAGHIAAQIERYEAIAAGVDWDKKRGYVLAWRMPDEPVFVTPGQVRQFPQWCETLGEFLRISPKSPKSP
ncbi:hypothetical protein GF380_00815 [Candidatus Uhrbacteria bacterium]|nr:hypothetical protein [Candidatus Uhrbacteria bacterium]